jgi:hypothetical protein
MKSIIITTGTSKIILTRWLPLLRTKGEYTGDVLVLDYGDINYFGKPVHLTDKSRNILKKEKGVTVLKPEKKLKNIFIDRLAVAQEYLKEHPEYDIVGFMDGNDTIVWGNITPLLTKAAKAVCYIPEHFSNLLSIWGDFGPRKFCQDNFADLFNLVENYGDEASDQVFMDIAFYRKMVKCREVGFEWNYTHAVIGTTSTGRPYGPRTPIFKDGKAFAVEDGREIVIEHRTGTGHRIWQSAAGVNLLNSDRPVPIMAEYNSTGNWLFRVIGVEEPPKEPKGLTNWLFR